MSLRITPTMLHSINARGLIEEVSEQWLATLGYRYDEVIGRPSTDFLSEESARYAREVVLPAFFATGACEVEYEMRRRDGTLIPVRLSGIAIRNERGEFLRSIAVVEDLTERRALERKMFEAQKLESLGLLAGNVAHDFNNLLASIVGNCHVALRHAADRPQAAEALHRIATATERAADLCRQLLAYSGRGRFQIEHVELDALVAEMVQVLEVNVGEGVALVTELGAAGERVEVDATQIRQIVMNLVLNASEALEGGTGSVRLTTRAVDLDAAAIGASTHRDIEPGRYLALEVADTGRGMSAEVLAQIFDPFFSTKSTGRGLGLAAVHGIVRGHHGTLRVDSAEGRGTRFSIFLPLAAPPAAAPAPQGAPAPSARATILVIDDDELLRGTLRGQLEGAGYAVLLASRADEAIALARTQGITGILIDVTMPGLSGPEIAARIRREQPAANIVLMSGYNRVDIPAEMRARFLRKPFSEAELLAALARAP